MGCFDFIYCDTGENIRGRNGYIYITKKLQDYCDLPNPIKFTSANQFGCFDCLVAGNSSTSPAYSFDIYALYAAQLYLEGIIEENTDLIQKYLNMLKEKRYIIAANEFDYLEYRIQNSGIEYFHDNLIDIVNPNNILLVDIPSIRNRKAKTNVACFKYFTGKLPLIISKGFIPSKFGIEPVEIAKNWGFVTGDDPEQGFRPTRKHFVKYQCNDKFDILNWFD